MMIVNYVTYDAVGNLDGGYEQEIGDEHLDRYILVTYVQRNDWTSYRPNAERNGVELIATSENPPPAGPEVPETISKRDWLRALFFAGILPEYRAAVLSGIDQVAELRRIDFDTLTQVGRSSTMATILVTDLGRTAEELDALFISAANT